MMSVVLVSGQTAAPSPPGSRGSRCDYPSGATQRAALDKYCVTCHNAKVNTANLKLDQLDLARLGDDAATWRKSRPEAAGRG